MPHNNTQQASQEATYMKPEDVSFDKPFKFTVPRYTSQAVYSYDPTDSDKVTITSPYGERFDTYTLTTAKKCVQCGDWLVLKQPESTQEALFGESFQFTVPRHSTVYLYKNGQYKIVGEDCWYDVSESFAREAVAEGEWTVLPSEPLVQPSQAPQQPSSHNDEDSFTYAEQMVAEALEPIGKAISECYSKQDWFGFFFEAKEPTSLLDVIKNACTQSSGRIVVTIYHDRYEVYHRPLFEDMVKVSESDLERFLGALLVVDSADKWE